jgi:microcystin-dependent protein
MGSTPYLGQIMMTSFNFAPKGWALCAGQLLPINQNTALFSVLGTTYGGDGQITFALPDLRGRVPLHTGSGFVLGQRAGEENHTLTSSELPAHGHAVTASANPANTASPIGAFAAGGGNSNFAAASATNTFLAVPTVADTGGSQPHPNLPPYLVISFVIALQGIFPSRS